MDTFLLKNVDSPIKGIYLSPEMIDLLSIIQCNNIDQLMDFVRECSQLSINESEMKDWKNINFESVKKHIFKKYKESFISTEDSTKDKKSVFQKTLLNAGLSQEDVQKYYDVFVHSGVEGIKCLLEQDHPDKYCEISKNQHEFIASERDQIKSVSYKEMKKINSQLPQSNTILLGCGRYYDVTNKLYNPNTNMKKYDFYHMKRGLDFCKRNGMHVRYHTLLDKQTMENVMQGKSKDEIISELKSYVKESIDFINQYNKQNQLQNGTPIISSLDLFNEIISFDKLNERGKIDKENGQYKNMWQELYGINLQDLSEIFKYANEHKPDGVTYVYNEPFLENDERRKVVIDTLKEINDSSPNLIDTLGTQMHIEMTQDPDEIKKEFADLKKLQNEGFKTQITEFDMCFPESKMFDKDGKLQTQFSAKQILDYKSKKMDEISQIIANSGIELEGVTYWSISDILDHNLQRTNQNTWKDGLNREVVTTRYAGKYSFATERPILFSEQEIGKATINTPITEKCNSGDQIKRDEQILLQEDKTKV